MKTTRSTLLAVLALAGVVGAAGKAAANAILLADDRHISVSATAGAPWGSPDDPEGWTWDYRSRNETESAPVLGANWAGVFLFSVGSGDGYDSECQGEAEIVFDVDYETSVGPDHFGASYFIMQNAWTYKSGTIAFKGEVTYRVQFALSVAHEFHLSGSEPDEFDLSLRDSSGEEQLSGPPYRGRIDDTGLLVPGTYILEHRYLFEGFGDGLGGYREPDFLLSLTPLAVPDSGQATWLLLGGLGALCALSGRWRDRRSDDDQGSAATQ